jgi:NAD(P)H dehydrogenase (quinone)
MKIAVTGATGHLGRLVIDRLKNKVPAADISALARTPRKAEDLGVEVREADYTKPETLGAALKGVDTLLLISSSELVDRVGQHHNIIEAAKKDGVKRIVYTSMLRANDSPISLAADHWVTEQELMASGIPFTILRNGWYTENSTGSIPGALAGGALLGSAGQGRISSAAREDYADAAVAAVLDESLNGKTLELAGDQAWTLAGLAAEISRQSGREIPYNDLPEADYAATLTAFGLPDDVARAVASGDVGASRGALYEDNHQLSALIGRPTTPMPQTVADALK